MSRWIKYTFSESAPPPEPSDTIGIWYQQSGEIGNPIPYRAGYYCARAWEDGTPSEVTRKSFEREVVSDYLCCYPLESDFTDASGNDYNATKISGTVTFSGTDMFIANGACVIAIPDAVRTILNSSNSASLSFWFKEGSETFNGCPVDFRNSSNGNENHFNYRGTHYLGILRNNRISKTKTLPTDTKIYHHYVITSEWKMYIDGQLYWTDSKGTLNMGSGNIDFGNGYADNSCYIKKFRIYNREITASEVTEIYNSEV